MKKLIPYQNINTALKTLDNGGRFYNILTKAEDGIISQAELGKVGGLFSSKQQSILFLEMSISALSKKEKARVLSQLDDGLQNQYQKYKAQYLLPSEAKEKSIISSNAIITGIPKLMDSKTDFLQLSAFDLAQRDMLKAINQSLEIYKIEFIQANLKTSQLGSFSIHYYGEFRIELLTIAFVVPDKEKIIEEIKVKTINFLENLEITKLENLKNLINSQILNEEYWNVKGLKLLSQNIKVN